MIELDACSRDDLWGRGVHLAQYRVDGDPVLVAVTAAGDLLKRVRLSSEVDEGCARAFLQGLLDHYDPEEETPGRPALRLVSGGDLAPETPASDTTSRTAARPTR